MDLHTKIRKIEAEAVISGISAGAVVLLITGNALIGVMAALATAFLFIARAAFVATSYFGG